MEPVIKPDGSTWMTFYDGCCLQWSPLTPPIILGSYIAANSTYDPQIDPYIPYIADEEIYYVPHNYDPDMPDPKKLLEIEDAPALTAMDYFIGTNADGDYKFTPAQLIAYVTPLIQRKVTVTVAGNRVDIPDLPPIQSIGFTNGFLTSDDITQDANGFETNEGTSWAPNQKLMLYF